MKSKAILIAALAASACVAADRYEEPSLTGKTIIMKDGTTSRDMKMFQFNTSVPIPAPALMPKAPNSQIALDLFPSGNPGDFGPRAGLTWLDSCDSVMLPQCSTFGMGTNGGYLGINNYGGRPQKPFHFRLNTDDSFRIEVDGTTTFAKPTRKTKLTIADLLAIPCNPQNNSMEVYVNDVHGAGQPYWHGVVYGGGETPVNASVYCDGQNWKYM